MQTITKSILVAAILMQTSMAFAQETNGDTEAETPTEEQSEDQTPNDLNLGEPVGPQVGETYVRQEFGDWEMRCVKTPEGQDDPCNLYQLLENDNGVAVAEFNLFRLPPGSRAAAGATIVVPLETLLTQQLTLAVDGANARRYPFTFCNPGGCVARLGFTEAEVQQFKRGNVATIRLVPAADPDQDVVLDVSLIGFTAGFDSSAVVE